MTKKPVSTEEEAFNPLPLLGTIRDIEQRTAEEELDTPSGRFRVYGLVSPTGFEKKVWNWMGKDSNPWRFACQVEQFGYILDFYSAKHNLCLEADGPDHRNRVAEDRKRDEVLLSHGIKTLRLRPIDFVKYSRNALVGVIEEFIHPRHDIKRSSNE